MTVTKPLANVFRLRRSQGIAAAMLVSLMGAGNAFSAGPVPLRTEVAEDSGNANAGDAPADAGIERYSGLLDDEANGIAPGDGGFERRIGAEVVTFDSAETDALLANGWQPTAPLGDSGFIDHGERVSTFVAIAEALGLDPSVGAEQANWGTPQENGLMDLVGTINTAHYDRRVVRYDIAELERHRLDAQAVLGGLQSAATTSDGAENPEEIIAGVVAEIAEVDRQLAELRAREQMLADDIAELENALGDAMGDINPRQSSPIGWELANLDVNGDGQVDLADLEAAQSGQRPALNGGAALGQ